MDMTDFDDDPDPTPEQMDAMLHSMVWGSGTEQSDSMTCGHARADHDEDGCNRPFCGCNWGTDEFNGETCGRSLADRRAGL